MFRIRLAVPHFSCIHFFYWKISHLGEILDLLSKMTWNAQSKHITLVSSCFRRHFGTVNPIFLQDDLFFSKQSVYMKNAEQRAGFETFCRKSCFFKYSLSKSTKTTPKWRPNLHYTSLEMTKSDLWNMIFPDRDAQTGSKGTWGKPPVQGDRPDKQWSNLTGSRQAVTDIDTEISKSRHRFPGSRSKVPLRGENSQFLV